MSKIDRLLEPDPEMITLKNIVLAVLGAAGMYGWTLLILVAFGGAA